MFVRTNFGNELCSQSIFANLIDENGMVIPQTNSRGNIVSLNVTYLFKNTWQHPNQDWIFSPNPDYIKEVDILDNSDI